MSPGTWEAALRSAGGAIFAVDEVVGRRVDNAFVATRPPGHHAETATAMGFCLFNNAAVAARHAQAVHGLERVAIVDFDVHHGNGTQDIFWSDASVMYASTHQMPLYPGTGARGECGEHDQIVNAPLRAGDGGDGVPRGVRRGDTAAPGGVRPRSRHRLRRLRRPLSRSARQSQPARGRLRLGDAAADGDRRRRVAAAASSLCSKAATISTGSAARRRPTSRALMGG